MTRRRTTKEEEEQRRFDAACRKAQTTPLELGWELSRIINKGKCPLVDLDDSLYKSVMKEREGTLEQA
jgi:hypothetical protein